jgi:hypothetical protein
MVFYLLIFHVNIVAYIYLYSDPQADLMMDLRTSAQDVMRCDLCRTTMVQMYCDTCRVSLCNACMGVHFSADPSKPHKFIHFKDRNSTLLYPGCTSHDKERCEMYCNPCHIPVCVTCIASNQHLGHKLLKIVQVMKEKKEKIAREKTIKWNNLSILPGHCM